MPAAWRAPLGVGPALEGVLPGGGGEPTSGRRGGEGPADGGAREGGGHPPGSGERAVCGGRAQRRARSSPAPVGYRRLLWCWCSVVSKCQASSPGSGPPFLFLTARGGGTAPACVLLEIATERVIASPSVWGGWRCRLLEALPRLRGVGQQSLRSAADCSQMPEAVLGGMGTGEGI